MTSPFNVTTNVENRLGKFAVPHSAEQDRLALLLLGFPNPPKLGTPDRGAGNIQNPHGF